MQLTYFSPEEFRKCVPPCELEDMDLNFMLCLDCARADSGVPFKLNSAYRPFGYELAKGRSGSGFHTKGRAVDISCKDSVSRMKIIKACLFYGLSCGISKTFIHVDNRPNQIVFLY